MPKQPQILDVRLSRPNLLRCETCRDQLQERLSRHSSIQNATIEPARARVRLMFDPESSDPRSIEQTVQSVCDQIERERAHLRMTVEGMDCTDCATQVEHAVQSLPGVQWARVQFASAQLEVELNPASVAQRDVARAVRQAGYRIAQEETQAARRLSEWGWLTFSGAFFLMGWLLYATNPTISKLSFGLCALLAGLPLLKGAWQSLRYRRLDMNALMTTAGIGAIGLGEWSEAAALMWLFALGNALQNRTLSRVRAAVQRLMEMCPPTARVKQAGEWVEVPVESAQVGDLIALYPGERVPVDGIIQAGESSLDESSLTGESAPVSKSIGDTVLAGTINLTGSLQILVQEPAHNTAIAKMIALIASDESGRAQSQQFIDRFAARYTPIVVLTALLIALLGPLVAGGDWGAWVHRALWLLIIACPCALVIATPVAMVAALGTASRQGAMIKGGIALENLANINTLVLDKTGTLTYAMQQLQDAHWAEGYSEQTYLPVLAALTAPSAHPVARAIHLWASPSKGKNARLEVQDFQLESGGGITGTIAGKAYALGSLKWMREKGMEIPAELIAFSENAQQQGNTLSVFAEDSRVLALFTFADLPRPEAAHVIQRLESMGIKTMIVSGDQPAPTESLARALGVSEWRAGYRPADKLQLIESLPQGARAAMVGDGINDVGALHRAHVGVAMGTVGADAAMEAADVVLLRDEIGLLPSLIRLARRAQNVVKFNVAVALGTKLILVVAGLLTPLGLWAAVAGDVGLSLLVTLHALTLNRWRA